MEYSGAEEIVNFLFDVIDKAFGPMRVTFDFWVHDDNFALLDCIVVLRILVGIQLIAISLLLRDVKIIIGGPVVSHKELFALSLVILLVCTRN
jgi:hypothetical protein